MQASMEASIASMEAVEVFVEAWKLPWKPPCFHRHGTFVEASTGSFRGSIDGSFHGIFHGSFRGSIRPWAPSEASMEISGAWKLPWDVP